MGAWQMTTGILLLTLTAPAQSPQSGPLAVLKDAPLNIWVLRPATQRNPRSLEIHLPTPAEMGYHEQTAGSFGQPASDVGTAASNVGQTAGSFGRTASSVGTDASNAGQTAGSFGQTAGSYGTAASNVGQTAGSFGQPASDFGEGHPAPGSNSRGVANPVQEDLAALLRQSGLGVRARFTDIYPDDLGERLQAAAGTSEAPDLLAGSLPSTWSGGLEAKYGLPMLELPPLHEDGVSFAGAPRGGLVLLARAPHLRAAEALALWWQEDRSPTAGTVDAKLTSRQEQAAAVARRAMVQLLQGSELGALADPQMAQLPGAWAERLLSTRGANPILARDPRVETMKSWAGSDLAVVALRVLVATAQAFGVLHPLLVLRRGDDGAWHVLHVSLNLDAQQALSEQARLSGAMQSTYGKAQGVTLAAPSDGDLRPPLPELWWDNHGGAALQAVEWQATAGGPWGETHLFLAPEGQARDRTRVVARFASQPGLRYRWRVWSVGGDALRLTGWRTLTITP